MYIQSSTRKAAQAASILNEETVLGLTAVLVSILVTACFLESAGETPLPHTLGAAAFLSGAVASDVRWMRIPNLLTFPALALAIGFTFATGGLAEGFASVAGALASFVVFGTTFALGWMGAGDVKATMVLGALWGPENLASVAWWMFVVGGLLAIVMLSARPGALADLARRWAKSVWYSLRMRRITYIAPPPEFAGTGLPFAVAMGLGATCSQIWVSPWT